MKRLVSGFDTRELLLIAFFAAFLVASRAALRWHLHVPGHSMLAAGFGLVLVRICVDRRGAALLCGTLAGMGIAALGMGQGGPLLVLKLAVPGALVDLGAALETTVGRRARSTRLVSGLFLGAAAGAGAVAPVALVEWLAGVDGGVIALHAVTGGVGRIGFGALGGMGAAWVGGELVHHGLVPHPTGQADANGAEAAHGYHSSE